MQPIFEVSNRHAPINRFEVPSHVAPLRLTSSSPEGANSAKRSRSGEAAGKKSADILEDAAARTALEQVILYGDQAEGATSRLWRQLAEAERPSRWCAPTSGAEASLLWRRTLPLWRAIVRKGMVLLCELVRKDEKALFLTGGVPAYELLDRLTKTGSDNAAAGDGVAAAASTAEASTQAPAAAKKGPATATVAETVQQRHSILGLYCLFQALDLELAAVLQVAEEHSGSALPKGAEEALEKLCQCAECYTDALEDSLIELVLTTAGSGGGPKNGASVKVDFAARMHYLEETTIVLSKAQWPCRLLYTANGPRPLHGCAPTEREWLLYHALLPRLEAVGNGSTAILKRALLDLARADVFHTLDTSVAVLRPAGAAAAAAGGVAEPEPARPLIRVDELSFERLAARIVSGAYAVSGVQRAQLEAKLLFMHLRHQHSGNEQELHRLCGVWEEALARHVCAFFEKGGGDSPRCRRLGRQRADETAESQLYFVRENSQLSDTQKKALAVMQRLLLVDTDGWFAIPAFDMSNLDFTSISLWIRGRTFARKTGRAAFDALVEVLERMVDSCVLMYGPTNPFSERVTKIRQHLVDACRREKLI